ncbi:MAG TPA: arsenite oxidase large subunit, partial [Dehalococcoidia bacterium]|nr:arsenite oxidase large subunit [Dehalococcoidia bacterium]
MVDYVPGTSVPLPPPDARVNNTACDYCIVGCGYRVFTWPDGVEGGARASENALGVDIPVGAGGAWISPNMHNYTLVDGVRHHVVVQPDPDSTVVNRGGNHSMRGGTLVGKVYNPDGPTSDRLKTPLMRVNGELVPVSWNDAIEVMQRVSSHVID